MNINSNEDVVGIIEGTKTPEVPTKRKYTRRSKEEIEKARAEKQAAAEERARKKAEAEAKKAADTLAKTNARKARALEKEQKNDEPKTSKKVESTAKKLKKSSDDEEPKKPAKKTSSKKGNGQDTIEPEKRGMWSNPNASLLMETMYVELELLESALGTSPSDPTLLETYIASKAPDAPSKEEEIAAIGETEVVNKSTTVFPRGWFALTENGQHYCDLLSHKDCRESGIPFKNVDKETSIRAPYFYDYQIRGMFKDSCGLLSRSSYGRSAEISAYKKVIDGGVFIAPRRIAIELPEFFYDEDGELREVDPDKLLILQRPLRISGPQGERTAIASSELIPAGSRIKFQIKYTDPKMREAIIEWLNYGCEHGLGAWRNSGRGSFRWREINKDYSPIIDEN